MVDYTFGADTISGLTSGTTTFTSGTAPYSFNPFSGLSSGGDDGGAITLRLALANLSIPGQALTHSSTLFTVVGAATTTTLAGSNVVQTFANMTDALAWLTSATVVDNSLKDFFSLTLTGADNTGTFSISTAANRYRIACFARGTMVRTPDGAAAVETLRSGDLVMTLSGEARPVKWIGHRTYEAGFGAAEAWVRPVLIRAGALGGNLPERDLRVSPQHALLVDDVLVPAAALINGATILRDDTEMDIEYYHIEMEGHEVVFAEGAPAETFVDMDSRAMFDNADEFALMFGTSQSQAVSARPRVEEGYQVEAIRRRLDRIAGLVRSEAPAGALTGNVEQLDGGVITGWAADAGNIDTAIEVDVVVAGEVVARVLANRYRTDLEQAGLGNGRHGFSVAVPASVEDARQVTLRRTDGQSVGEAIGELARA